MTVFLSAHATSLPARPPGPPRAPQAPIKQEKRPPGPPAGAQGPPRPPVKQERGVVQEEVECVAPYEEVEWVGLGRREEGAPSSSVQYAHLLRPPSHLTSLLRLQPAAQKGLAATEANTIVFMVMEGEVTVVLNTTQFLVTRGDSFFVPPHNTYNLLNLSSARAELYLVQYRHQP